MVLDFGGFRKVPNNNNSYDLGEKIDLESLFEGQNNG